MKRPTRITAAAFAAGAAIGAVTAAGLADSTPDGIATVAKLALLAGPFTAASSLGWHEVEARIHRREDALSAGRHRRPVAEAPHRLPRPADPSGTMAVRPPVDAVATEGQEAADDQRPATASPWPPSLVAAATDEPTMDAEQAERIKRLIAAVTETYPSALDDTVTLPAPRAVDPYLTPSGPDDASDRIARLDDTDDGWAALATVASGHADLYWHPQATS